MTDRGGRRLPAADDGRDREGQVSMPQEETS